MASGTVESCRYVTVDSPVRYSYSKKFTGGERTYTTATETGYTGTSEDGYINAFAGFTVNDGRILINAISANAHGSNTVMGNRNIASSDLTKNCTFNRTFMRSDLLQDERT